MRGKRRIGLLMLVVVLLVGVASAQEKEGGKPQTGNDPRDFTSKFMPYYRYTELENGMKTQDFTIFGMWAMTKNFALTYETPVARKYDITETAACAGLPAARTKGATSNDVTPPWTPG